MKEVKVIFGDHHMGYRIYPFLDKYEPIKLQEYIEIFFDTEFLNAEVRQKIQVNIHPHGIGKMMSLEQTRLLIDALERGMQILAQDHHDKLKKELETMRKKVTLEER